VKEAVRLMKSSNINIVKSDVELEDIQHQMNLD